MKNKLLYLAVCTAVLAFAAVFCINGDISSVLSSDAADCSATIILDPGHGGVDPGAIGINGIEEKNINLDIALTLRDILTVNGYEVIMTRDTDAATNDAKYKEIGQLKTSDLKNRLKLINAHENAVALLIHQNKYTAEKYSGAQMFYGRLSSESKPLADALQQAFKANLQPQNTRLIKPSTSAVYVLHNAKPPTVLVECGFISNSYECSLLSDADYRKKVAFTIFCGLEAYRSEASATRNDKNAKT